MLIECIGSPFTCRWSGGSVYLEPGKPIDLPDEQAQRLLRKVPDRVRIVEPLSELITIEPAHPQARPLYWERATGIVGPAAPEFMVKVGEAFWIVAQFEGVPVWIHSDRLRSRQQFKTQVIRKPVNLIKE